MKPKAILDDWQPNLILGIEQEKAVTPIGFGTRSIKPSARSTEKPILYEDDAPICTVAPTRSGKGRGVLLPNLLRYSGAVYDLDLRGEHTLVAARRRKEMGQDVYVIDPTNHLDLSSLGLEPAQLNPLDAIQLPAADLEIDSASIAEMLSRGIRGTKEPFWDQKGCGLLQALILIAASDADPANRNLGKVAEMLSADDITYSLAVILDTRGKSLNRTAYQKVAQVLQLPEVTRGGVIGTAQSYMQALASPSVLKTLSASSFPLQRIIDGDPLTLFVVVPPSRLHALKGLVKLVFGTIISAIMCRKHRPSVPSYMALDEVCQLETFPVLETLMTLCSGYGVRTHIFLQDLAQLRTHYSESWKTILNNSACIQTFGINNGELAADFGRYLDLSATELMQMGRDQQALAIQGRGTIRCERLDYLRDAPKRIYDSNPLFEVPRRRKPNSEPAVVAK